MNGGMISNLCRAVTIVRERFEQGDKLARIDISLAIEIPPKLYDVVGRNILHPITGSAHAYVNFIRPTKDQINHVWIYDSEHSGGIALDITSEDFTERLDKNLNVSPMSTVP